jgi:hypothetical protein
MMLIVVQADGQARCLYGECIDLHTLGSLTIQRASQVEPDADGRWWVDLSPLKGTVLGPFTLRSQALEAEQRWIEEHHLLKPQ